MTGAERDRLSLLACPLWQPDPPWSAASGLPASDSATEASAPTEGWVWGWGRREGTAGPATGAAAAAFTKPGAWAKGLWMGASG